MPCPNLNLAACHSFMASDYELKLEEYRQKKSQAVVNGADDPMTNIPSSGSNFDLASEGPGGAANSIVSSNWSLSRGQSKPGPESEEPKPPDYPQTALMVDVGFKSTSIMPMVEGMAVSVNARVSVESR